jgi:signal transduction histidine kinase
MSDRPPLPIDTIPLSDVEVRRRKAYLEISPVDEARLLAAHQILERHAGGIVEEFYAFLLSHDHTRKMLSAPGLIERLKRLQTRYFSELTAGRYDVDYFQNRVRVGLAHSQVGLSPEWYLGAYLKYLNTVGRVLRDSSGMEEEEASRILSSLGKIIFLDMSLAIDAYIASAQGALSEKASELARANEELHRLDAAKRHLTGAIVHDLQNPLAGIIAFLQVLGSRPAGLTKTERESLSEALARCNDLSSLILDVLQMNRAEEGKLELYIENLDLGEVTRSAVQAFALVAEQEGRSLAYVPPVVPVSVRSDQSLLRRVLYNLIRNALQHTPTGTHVEVSLQAGPPWSLAMRDDGPGIPAEMRGRIFEPGALRNAGYQVQSGLGLVFCKRAAESLGMSLRLDSEPPRGTCFILEARG